MQARGQHVEEVANYPLWARGMNGDEGGAVDLVVNEEDIVLLYDPK